MDRPGFYFCICPDAAFMHEALTRDLLQPVASESSEIATFWGDEGLDRRFWDMLTLLSLDARLQVLVVRGAQQLSADIWKKLSSALAVPHPSALPVFCLEGPWEKGKPKIPAHIAKLKCLSFADSKRWIWRSAGLDGRSMRPYIQRRSAEVGLRLDNEALNALAGMLIPDASAIRGVLDQLCLAARDGEVDVSLVRQMTEFTPEAVIFDVIRLLEHGHDSKVWNMLLREGDGGESLFFPLLTLMAREGRMLWQMLAGDKVYCPQYVEDEKRRIATELGFSGMARLFAALAHAEFVVKSGAMQPLQAMERLVAELSLVFANGEDCRG